MACCLQALDSCQGTTERLRALEAALSSKSLPPAETQANVVAAICCHACHEGSALVHSSHVADALLMVAAELMPIVLPMSSLTC